jgi:hypothetical protein
MSCVRGANSSNRSNAASARATAQKPDYPGAMTSVALSVAELTAVQEAFRAEYTSPQVLDLRVRLRPVPTLEVTVRSETAVAEFPRAFQGLPVEVAAGRPHRLAA